MGAKQIHDYVARLLRRIPRHVPKVMKTRNLEDFATLPADCAGVIALFNVRPSS